MQPESCIGPRSADINRFSVSAVCFLMIRWFRVGFQFVSYNYPINLDRSADTDAASPSSFISDTVVLWMFFDLFLKLPSQLRPRSADIDGLLPSGL